MFPSVAREDRDKRTYHRTLEMVMMPSASLDIQMFTGITPGYGLHIRDSDAEITNMAGSLPGFNWDLGSNCEPIQDDPRLENYNVQVHVHV